MRFANFECVPKACSAAALLNDLAHKQPDAISHTALFALRPPRTSLDSGQCAANDMDMEARVTALEEAITEIKIDLAVLKATSATKEDLHRELNAQTWRLVTFVCGFNTALVGATYFIVTHFR